MQTTLTRISLPLNQNHTVCPKVLGKLGNSNVFSDQKQVVSKKVFTEIETDFPAKFGDSNVFSDQKQVVSKKVFTEIETDFPAKFGDSNVFSDQKQVVSKKIFNEIETDFPANIRNSNAFSDRITTCSSQLRLPIFFAGGCFQFFTKNRPQKPKNVQFCILHKPMGGGGLEPPPPGYATGPNA